MVQNPLAVPELPLAGAPADLALLGAASRPLCVEGGLHVLAFAGDSWAGRWSLSPCWGEAMRSYRSCGGERWKAGAGGGGRDICVVC